MEDLVDLAHEAALARYAGSRGRGAGAQGRGRGRGRGAADTAATSGNARGSAEVRREDGTVQCTFSGNGDDFIDQHWYFCYTCGLVDSKGCCSACAQVCHAGHDLVYSTHSRFFCDCGAGVPRCPACKCLGPVQPPQAPSTNTLQAATPAEDFPVLGHPFNGLQDWDPSDEPSLQLDRLWQIPPADDTEELFSSRLVQKGAQALRELCAEDNGRQAKAAIQSAVTNITSICSAITSKLIAEAENYDLGTINSQAKVSTGTGPAAAVTGDAAAQEARLVHFKGSFKLAAEPRGVPRSAALAAAEAVLGRDSQEALEAHMVSQCTASASPATGLLAVVRARQLTIVDLAAAATAALAPSHGLSSGESMAVLARHSARFDMLQVQFDPVAGGHLAVAGLRTVQVWSVTPSAKVTDRLPLRLPTPQAIQTAATAANLPQLTPAGAIGAYMDLVLDIAWLPGSDTCLAVTMPLAVLVYDLTSSAQYPAVAVVLPSTDTIASAAVGTHLVPAKRDNCQVIQHRLLILTREANLWTAVLPDPLCRPYPTPTPGMPALTIQPAVAVGTTSSPSARLAQSASGEGSSPQANPQLYGKHMCYCPAATMYIASLGNVRDEHQIVMWRIALDLDNSGEPQLSCTTEAVKSQAAADSAPAAPAASDVVTDGQLESSEAALQDLDADQAEQEAEEAIHAEQAGQEAEEATHAESDDDDSNDEEEEDTPEEEEEDNTNTHSQQASGVYGTRLPCIDRSYAVPLLPATRESMHNAAALLIGASIGLPGALVTSINQGSDTARDAAMQHQFYMVQGSVCALVGVASLPLPHAQQVAIATVDSQGGVYLYSTPLADRIVVWDAAQESTAEQTRQAALGSTAGTAASAAAATAQEGRQTTADSGRDWGRFLDQALGSRGRDWAGLLAHSGSAASRDQLEQLGSPMLPNTDMRSRAVGRLLAGSSSSLGSSGSQGLAVTGQSLGAAAQGISEPALAAAPTNPVIQFPFDFFEKTRCISGEVRLSGDLSQAGSSERAWRVLLAAGTYLEAPSASSMRINIRPNDSSLVVVGVRVMIGGSGGRYSPSEIKLGGRVYPLPTPSAKRWHALYMTPAEALAAAPDTPMQVGVANNAASLARLDGLEVYARPKADVVKEAAKPAEAEAAAAPQGALGANLALAAVCLPRHLAAPTSQQTCMVYILSQGLLTLTSLHQYLIGPLSMQDTAQDLCASAIDIAEDLLYQSCRLSAYSWQPSNMLTCAAWTLLAACLPNQAEALQQKIEEVDLESLGIAKSLQRVVKEAPLVPALWPDQLLWQYMLISAKVLTIATRRIASLLKYFQQEQQEDTNSELMQDRGDQLLGLLVSALPWVLQSLQARTGNPQFPARLVQWLVQSCVAVVAGYAQALEDGDVTDEFKSEHMPEMAGWLADLLHCYQKDVSNAASWQIAQLILTSETSSEEQPSSSNSIQPVMPKLSTNMHISSSTAKPLSSQLVASILDVKSGQEVPNSLAGFDLLARLALADLQAGNERVQGVAKHVANSAAKALSSATSSNETCKLSTVHTINLRLLAQICTACQDSSDASPGAAEDAPASGNAEAVEAVLTVIRSAEQLPKLLLSVVKGSVQQIQQLENSEGRAGLLREALPGEATGCGELLRTAKPPRPLHRDASKQDVPSVSIDAAMHGAGAHAATAEAALHVAAAVGPSLATQAGIVAAWKEVLSQAQQCEQLSKGRKPMRKLMLQLYGDHSAYHDAKALTRLVQAYQALQAAVAAHSTDSSSHSAAQQLVSALSKMKDAAEARPKVWLAVATADRAILPALVAGLLSWQMPSALERGLQLLGMLLPAPELPKDGLKLDKATRDLDLQWLFVTPSNSSTPSSSVPQPGSGSAPLPATPYAHLVLSLLLSGRSKAVCNQACNVCKSLWLLESAKALSSKPATSAPAQRAQRAMLTLLLQWVPSLSAYPDSVTLYFQLLTWVITVTPSLPEQLKGEAASAKKKTGSGSNPKMPPRAPQQGVPQLDRPRSSSGSSGSGSSMAEKVEGLMQEVVAASAVQQMFHAVKWHNAVLADNTHGSTYQALQRLVNFEGYFLDGENASSVPSEPVYQTHKLDSLEAEVKFTEDRIMTRLTSRYQIKSFTLQVHNIKKPRSVRQVHIYHCSHPVGELSELKTRPDLWRKCATLNLKPYQGQAKHSLTVPISASCIMVEFAELWENLGAVAGEVLQCPRCSQVVAHPQGYCHYCKENAYQCRHCRNINHEKLDAFMCNECGHSRFGKFELSTSASPCTSYPAIQSQDDMLRALASLEHTVSTAHAWRTSLNNAVKTLTGAMAVWNSPPQGPQQQPTTTAATAATAATAGKAMNIAVAAVATAYNDKCKPAHEAAVQASLAVASVRSALTAYLRQGGPAQQHLSDLAHLQPVEILSAGNSYRAGDTFLTHCLPFLLLLAKAQPAIVCPALEQTSALQQLFGSNLKLGSPAARQAARQLLLLMYQQGSSASKQALTSLIKERVLYCIHHHRSLDVAASMQQELGLFTELITAGVTADAQAWQSQMLLLFQLLLPATGAAGCNPAISEHVIVPCLKMLLHTIGAAPSPPPANGIGASVRPQADATAQQRTLSGTANAQASTQGRGAEQRLVEEVGPGLSLNGLGLGRISFQSYLDRSSSQAGMLATGALNQQARQALRCGRTWRRHAETKAVQRSTGTAPQPPPNPALATPQAPPPQPQLNPKPAISSLPLLESEALLSALLLNPANEIVRSLSVSLLKSLCLGSPHTATQLASRLAKLLPLASAAGPAGEQYFGLLQEQVADTASAMLLVAHNALDILMQQIKRHVSNLVTAEYGCQLKLLHIPQQPPAGLGASIEIRGGNEAVGGYALTRLTALLATLVAAPGAPVRFARAGLLEEALLALAGLSAVEVGRTHLTDDAEGTLMQLLHESWLSGGLAARSQFARAGMKVLTQLWDEQSSTHMPRLHAHLNATILEEVCSAIKQESTESVYLMLLDKSPTQEEFIRGQLTNNPYNSAETGPLMRDVKNFICRELDMEGLVDDDFGMELLVGGAIVSLSLPVRLVWECVWRPTLPPATSDQSGESSVGGPGRGEVDVVGPPMVVTYRLQGLDGEATERMIEHLAEPASEQQEPEQEYAVAKVLAEDTPSGSLASLLKQLVKSREPTGQDYRLLLKLLHYASHLQVCRQAMLAAGALQSLLQHLHQLLLPIISPTAAAASGGAVSPGGGSTASRGKLVVAADNLDILLATLEALASSDAAADSRTSAKGLGVDVHGLADGLKALVESGLAQSAAGLARVLPYLAHGNTAAQAALLDHYAACLNLAALEAAAPDTPQHQAQQSELQSLLRLTEATEEEQQASTSASFRALVLNRLIPISLADYILELFTVPTEPPSHAQTDTSGGPGPQSHAQTDASVTTEPQKHAQTDGNADQASNVNVEESQHQAETLSNSAVRDSEQQEQQSQPRSTERIGSQQASSQESMGAGRGTTVNIPEQQKQQKQPERTEGVASQQKASQEDKQDGEGLCKRGSEQWIKSIAAPGLPWALQLLAAFACNHQATCVVLAAITNLLVLLHQLEAVSSGSTIGPLAENLLEQLQQGGGVWVRGVIKGLRAATKAEMKKKAMARRKAMLASLNMPSPSQAEAPSSSTAEPISSLSSSSQHAQQAQQNQQPQQAQSKEEEEERRGLVCMVCKEGYAARPQELLAAYCYCMKLRSGESFGAVPEVWKGSGSARSDSMQAWMCVSHFNLIHSSCHQAAKQADSALRAPKREWEGATLRNGETLCNNLLPLRCGNVSDTQHAAAVASFMEGLGHAPHRDSHGSVTISSGSRRSSSSQASAQDAAAQLGAITGCIASLLQRFAFAESLSVESRGGGRQSNARLLPYLFQLGTYFAGFCSDSDLQAQKARLDQLTHLPQQSAAHPSSGQQSSAQPSSSRKPDTATAYLLTLSLFLWTPAQWSQNCCPLLLSCLRFAFQQAKPGDSTAATSGLAWEGQQLGSMSDDELWRLAFPFVRFFGLVQHLHAQLKGPDSTDSSTRSKSRLEDLPATVEAADAMLDHLGAMEAADTSAQCFELLGLKPSVQERSQHQGPLSSEDCMHFLRTAL